MRHGLPERVETDDGAAADPRLSDVGRAQAELLAEYLATEAIDAVYASPLRRAGETIAPLAARLGLPVTIVDDVAEFDRHATEYIPAEELRATRDQRFHEMTFGTWSDMAMLVPFRERVVTALDQLVAAHPGERIVVGCHAGVVLVYLGEVLGLPLDRRGFLYPNYTSVHRVAASRAGVRTLITVNETSHLRHSGLPMGLIQSG